MSALQSLVDLWRPTHDRRVAAIYGSPSFDGGFGAYEFNLDDGSIVKVTLEHLGLVCYDAPIFPDEYCERLPLDLPCVGEIIKSVHARIDPKTDRPQRLRLQLGTTAIQFRFVPPDAMVMEPADDSTDGWIRVDSE